MKKSNLLFLVLLILFSCNKKEEINTESGGTIGLNEQDSLVMVKFNESMGGLGWNLKDYNTWEGVSFVYDETTKKHYVNKIIFRTKYKDNKGSIPKEIGKLSRLEYLTIQDDWGLLSGEFPNEIFNCPLIKFTLVGDYITGELNSSIGKIANTIVSFWIGGTAIGGELPSEFGSFQNLISPLSLAKNRFSGKLPKTFNSIPRGVLLMDNNISSIDWDFFDIDINSSWSVIMKGNRLQGEIPEKVLNSPIWKKWSHDFGNQQEGYGFSNYN